MGLVEVHQATKMCPIDNILVDILHKSGKGSRSEFAVVVVCGFPKLGESGLPSSVRIVRPWMEWVSKMHKIQTFLKRTVCWWKVGCIRFSQQRNSGVDLVNF